MVPQYLKVSLLYRKLFYKPDSEPEKLDSQPRVERFVSKKIHLFSHFAASTETEHNTTELFIFCVSDKNRTKSSLALPVTIGVVL